MTRKCSECGSENVAPDTDKFVKRLTSSTHWKCSECGYSGFMPETSKMPQH